MALRFPRCIASPAPRAPWPGPMAPPGTWAITGAFRYAHRDPATLIGREAPVFRASWYGLGAFAPVPLVEVAEIAPATIEALARDLAAHLLGDWNAPNATSAIETAQEEIAFALALAEHPPGTVLELARQFEEQGMIERARILSTPPSRR